MRFIETALPGAWLVVPEPITDERGFFQRTFCEREFEAHGLPTRFVQHSTSYSARAGTLRGLHFQLAPHTESKVVSCRRGTIFDVIVDVRRGSPTFSRWIGVELSARNHHQLFVPQGFAHGFQSLSDDAEVSYLISEFYAPAASAGVRYDDPSLAIEWPLPVTAMSPRDQALPLLAKLEVADGLMAHPT